MQVTLIKLSKFISSPTNANQMLISYFPYITTIIIIIIIIIIINLFIYLFKIPLANKGIAGKRTNRTPKVQT